MRLLGRLVLLLGLAVVVAVAVTAVRVWDAGQRDAGQKADAIVVLGAAQYDGRPQDYLAARLAHAERLYEAHRAPRVLTLGGKRPGDRFTEADAGQLYLVAHGVPSDAVLRVGEGSDTLESVRAAAAVMKRRGWTSAVVVTDPWHELRSTTMLADQGIDVSGSPVTAGPSVQGPATTARYVGRETAAYLVYELGRVLS